MVYEQRSAHGLAVEGVTALVIIAVLLFLFSTSLWISIPQTSKIQLGDFIIIILTALFIQRSEHLVSPLSAVTSLALHIDIKRTSAVIQGFLRFLSITVAYFSLKRTSINLLTMVLDYTNSHIIYDAVFITLLLLHLYYTVKKLVR
ncbi:MAG: hypothetical protein ABWK01_09300 [Infirmifilum sp.]